MRIGILQTAYKKASEYGAYYNVQELGLGRALAKLGYDTVLYKAVDGEGIVRNEYYGKFKIVLISSKYVGINGMIDTDVLDPSLDVLIYFCDIQLKVPTVYKWCKYNGVFFVPYVGVIKSHSENIFKRMAMNFKARKNIRIYKKIRTLCKTPEILEEMSKIGCKDLHLAPVGLDETVMQGSFLAHTSNGEKVPKRKPHPLRLLFIGRMEEEKQPLEMVRIIDELLSVNKDICVAMIGDGYMYEEVEKNLMEVASKHGCAEGNVNIIRKVPYDEMYLYYRNSDVYINLNKVEILGMSILESMYYGCPVIAIDAPGPNYIMNTEEETGILAADVDDVIAKLKDIEAGKRDLSEIRIAAAKRVARDFVWDSLADRIIDIITEPSDK